MAKPNLKIDDIQQIIPQASDIELVDDTSGQKLVFSGIISGIKYALKFMKPNPQLTEEGTFSERLDDVTVRAQREVETMGQCETPYLVKIGPISLETEEFDGEPIIYFSEEFIEGENLKQYLQSNGQLSASDLIKLGSQISEAIDSLWQHRKIHRDIKPGNIMRRSSNGDFVLLDMGLVFDFENESISLGPVGTRIYFSPEQMDFANRRQIMDFRSDLFSLGIVMYEMATGEHPFIDPITKNSFDVLRNIANMNPTPPVDIRNDLSNELSDVILRLLAKRPALRFRSIEMFQRDLRIASERMA
ncbi:serine/threonine protein kinase [bacterium]|nr:serine/threonine protein kinase [bacterium]